MGVKIQPEFLRASSETGEYKEPAAKHTNTRRPLKIRAGPDGIHFSNRVTGMNLLLDEVKVPVELWATAPRQVSIALTNRCDLHCPYCYAPKYKAELSNERLLPWLNELDLNGCLGVGFGGGEPTLHPELSMLCQHVAQNTGLAVTFTTHGHRIDDQLAVDLSGNVHFIRVSMDGVSTTYEMLRGRSLSSLRRRFDTVREIAPFGINFVVNAFTFPDLNAAVALAAEVGASEFLLLPERPVRGHGGIENRTARELRHWVASYQGAIPLSVSEAGATGLPTCNPFKRETGLRAYAHIDASGVVMQSSYGQAGVSIGTDGIMQALETLEKRIGAGNEAMEGIWF